jgi:hypothetical protein
MFRVKANTVNPIFEETVEYFLPHFHLGNHKIEAGHRVHTVQTLLFSRHRLSMELDLQSLYGLLCTAFHWLRPRNSPPPPAFGLIVIYEGAIGQPR